MYDNIGEKIKTLAKVSFFIEAIGAVITGITLMTNGDNDSLIILGVLTLILGPLMAWASLMLIYGFGELINKTSDIARNTASSERKSEAQTKIESEKLGKIERLRSQGLITEEEYQQAISKIDEE